MKEVMNAVDVESVKKGSKVYGYIQISSMIGVKIQIPLVVVKSYEDGPVLNVHGGIHGNEYEGMQAIIHLIREMKPRDLQSGTLLLTPIVNALAFSWVMRNNPLDLKDLARNFPGKPHGSVSQLMAYEFFNKVVKKSDYVIGLHSAGKSLKLVPFTEFFDDSGRVGEESLVMAKAFGLKYLRRIKVPRDTVTCTYKAAEQGIPAIEPEIHGEERCDKADVDRYVNGVKNVMRHLGMMEGEIEQQSSYEYMESEWVNTQKGGFFVPIVELEQEVKKGDKIGVVYDWFGNEDPIESPSDGLIIGIRTLPALRPGEVISHIGKVYKTVE